MADRAANRNGVVVGLTAFARSLGLLALLVVGLPIALVSAARERFGGGAPFHGVPSPLDWSAGRIRTALTDRLTEQTIADIVIRLALVVAWVGVVVIVVTVVAETVHMVKHDGLAMPDVRGLGFTQRGARMIASGLLVLVPMFTSPSTAVANDATLRLPDRSVASVLEVERSAARVDEVPVASDPAMAVDAAAPTRDYVVRPGDSIYGIAERLVGPDTARVAAFAEQLVDANLGRRMPDGRTFDNAAFIDVGWVLELPGDSPVPADELDPGVGVHVVARGESLWSIADDELGDPSRWPEVYRANQGREFDDGRRLDDPDVLRPGWDLRLPVDPDPVAGEVVTNASDAGDGGDDVDIDIDIDIDDVDVAPVPSVDTSRARVPVDEVTRSEGDVDLAADHPDGASAAMSARPDNVWDEMPHESAGADRGATPSVPEPGRDADERSAAESAAPRLLPLGGAAMLSAGVLALLGVRRRTQLRRARPRSTLAGPTAGPVATERVLRAIDAGERFDRVETAIRAVATTVADRDERVTAAFVGADGALELRLSGPVSLPSPWDGDGDGPVWHLTGSTPLELLADSARSVGPPCPALVQLGTDDSGRDVYVDLEAIEAIEVGGPGAQADAVIAGIATTLAGSLLAEVTTLVGLGVADEAFLGHRRYVPVRDQPQAFETAAETIGSTRWAESTTFVLRVNGTATETWEPTVVLIGASAGAVNVPDRRTGLAVVSASSIHGPSSRLAPDGDAWLLQPAGIRLTPVGLSAADVSAIAELVTVADLEPDPGPAAAPTPREEASEAPLPFDRAALDEYTIITDRPLAGDDHRAGGTIASGEGVGTPPVEDPTLPHELLVRMIGPVVVSDRDGNEVGFERSKTRELIAWLATHRERSTRSSARTALWELDVRDATFANVVSEARRSMARLVEPPEGDEWVGRTMTDALPLHDLVVSDGDVLRHALDRARRQPPAQAIETLAPGVDLIAGVPFEGTAYLWPDSEGLASDLVLLATTATTELAAHCLSIGDIEGVFRSTARGLQVLPGHEELIGLRMEAHARAGDRAGVRHEWESYERVINGDPWSDGEPAPKLVELRRRLLNPSR